MDTHIKVSEYQSRRSKVLKALRGSIGVVFAGEGGAPLVGKWMPDPFFYYLTGIADERGACVVFDPSNPDPSRRCVLYLKPLLPEIDAWDGYRAPLGAELRKATGFDRVLRTLSLPRFLSQAAIRTKSLTCLHPFGTYEQPVTQDLQLFRKLAERIPGVAIEDRTDLLPKIRGVKSRAEVSLIKRALEATKAGHEALVDMLEPGISERDLHIEMDHAFKLAGGAGAAYNPIIGAGVNSTVLHYMANDQPINQGDILCVDAGSSFGGYAADITRSYPADGKFTKRQRKIYDIVREALDAGVRAAKPGASMSDVDAAAREIIDRAGFGDTFVHGIGHHLGLEVHDVEPGGTLEPGHVITIEPGIYLKDEGIGVRLEEDVQITASGKINLSKDIEIDPGEIEKRMARAKRRRG